MYKIMSSNTSYSRPKAGWNMSTYPCSVLLSHTWQFLPGHKTAMDSLGQGREKIYFSHSQKHTVEHLLSNIMSIITPTCLDHSSNQKLHDRISNASKVMHNDEDILGGILFCVCVCVQILQWKSIFFFQGTQGWTAKLHAYHPDLSLVSAIKQHTP